MKAVFVGGGSLRLLGILRGALAEPKVFKNGHIHLHDLDVTRAEALGRMVMKSPEYQGMNCKITWGDKLDKALPGADMVGVILRAGSPLAFELGTQASVKRGFASSDNISPNGAFLALKGGQIIMGVAKLMEKYCPKALLVNFVNPIAVFSAMVNNHTKIRCVGVCAGFTNHMWDLSRVLYSRDEEMDVFDVDVAGVNHISYIVGGTAKGKDIFKEMDKVITKGWKKPKMLKCWSKSALNNIIGNSCTGILKNYERYGALIFSTEGDGLMHLSYEESFKKEYANWKPKSLTAIKKSIADEAKARVKMDKEFQYWLDKDLDQKFWDEHWKGGDMVFRRVDNDIFVKIMKAIAGCGKYKIAVSTPNNGAVKGFRDTDVLEYSQIIDKGGKIKAAGSYSVPDTVYGLTAALSVHQTMLGEAMATDDPKLLARTLMAYPVRPYSDASRELYRELAKINVKEIQPGLRKVADFLK